MQLTNVKSPKWANAEHTTINVTVTHAGFGEIPFSASTDDVEAHGRAIFSDAVAGKFGEIAPYIAPVIPRTVPRQVTRYQGRAALLQMGLLDDVDAFVAALPVDTPDESANLDNRLVKMIWAESPSIDRAGLLAGPIASATGMNDAQMDDLFCFAATIA